LQNTIGVIKNCPDSYIPWHRKAFFSCNTMKCERRNRVITRKLYRGLHFPSESLHLPQSAVKMWNAPLLRPHI
jgi:hypothetical protein